MRFLLPALALVFLSAAVVPAQESDVETVDVEFDLTKEENEPEKKLVLKFPTAWKEIERGENEQKEAGELGRYTVPKSGSDSADGMLALYDFGRGGGVKANIDRWVGNFDEEGRTETVRRGIIGTTTRYFIVELTGTYNEKLNGSTEAREKYRLLGAILGIQGKGVFFLQLTGPDGTVTAEGASLRASFGADPETEKEVNLDDLK